MASAGLLPMLIYGRVTFEGKVYSDQEVIVYSPRLDHEWTFSTNGNGIYEMVLNGLKDDLQREIVEGDVVNIRVCPPESNLRCEKTVRVSSNPQRIDWDVTWQDPKIVITTTEPNQPPIVCPGIGCPVDLCDESDGIGSELLTGAISFLFGAGALYFLKRGEISVKGVGIKIYTNRNGERVRQHRHPGIVGYHNPLTSHRLVRERHPKGQLDPEYLRADDGEWTYVE